MFTIIQQPKVLSHMELEHGNLTKINITIYIDEFLGRSARFSSLEKKRNNIREKNEYYKFGVKSI